MSAYKGDWKNFWTIDLFEVPSSVGMLTDVEFWKDLFSDLQQTQRKYARGLSDIVNKLTERYKEERLGETEMSLFRQMVQELRVRLQHNASFVLQESDITKNKLDRLTEYKDETASAKKLKNLQHQCGEAKTKYKKLCKKMESVTQKFEDKLTKLESLTKDTKVTSTSGSKLKARVYALVIKYQNDAEFEETYRQDMVMKCGELKTAWIDVVKPKATIVINSILSRKSARLDIDRLFEEIGNSSSKTSNIPVFKEELLDRYEELAKRKSEGNHESVYNGSGDHDDCIVLGTRSSFSMLRGGATPLNQEQKMTLLRKPSYDISTTIGNLCD